MQKNKKKTLIVKQNDMLNSNDKLFSNKIAFN